MQLSKQTVDTRQLIVYSGENCTITQLTQEIPAITSVSDARSSNITDMPSGNTPNIYISIPRTNGPCQCVFVGHRGASGAHSTHHTADGNGVCMFRTTMMSATAY